MPITLWSTRNDADRRARLTARVAAAAVLGFGLWHVLRAVTHVRRAGLRSDWTAIRGYGGATSLAVHARVSDDRVSSLPPLVLVHGYGIGSSYFVPLAARLRDHAHVYAPDLPGHGPSDHDVRPLTIRELGDALAAWMDARGLGGAVLVGHSIGSQIVAEVAARRADLVSGLVLIAPASDPRARTVLRQVVRASRGAAYERPSLVVWAAIDYTRAGPRVLTSELRQLVRYRVEDVLPHATVPVRVIRGAQDRLVPQAWAEEVARLVGAPPPTVIRRWGHAVHYDDPEAVATVVLELAHQVAMAADQDDVTPSDWRRSTR